MSTFVYYKLKLELYKHVNSNQTNTVDKIQIKKKQSLYNSYYYKASDSVLLIDAKH